VSQSTKKTRIKNKYNKIIKIFFHSQNFCVNQRQNYTNPSLIVN